MKKNLFNNLLILCISIWAIIIVVTEQAMPFDRLLQMLGIIPVMLIPKVLRLIGIKLPRTVESIYLVFIILAYFLGIALSFYGKYPFFDKFTHFTSGAVTALGAIIVLVKTKHYDRKNVYFNALYMILVTLSVAACWEFFEFTCDHVFNRDAQRVLLTGVSDTMEDMISAFLASILVAIPFVYEMKNNIKGVFTKFISSL